MEIEIFTLADYAADYGNGKLVISGTFDSIFSQGFPFSHPNCAIALRIRLANSEAGEHEFEVRPIGIKGIQPLKGTMNVQRNRNADHATVNIVLNMNNISFEKPGKVAFEFYFDGEFRSGLSLYVVKAGPPPPVGSPN